MRNFTLSELGSLRRMACGRVWVGVSAVLVLLLSRRNLAKFLLSLSLSLLPLPFSLSSFLSSSPSFLFSLPPPFPFTLPLFFSLTLSPRFYLSLPRPPALSSPSHSSLSSLTSHSSLSSLTSPSHSSFSSLTSPSHSALSVPSSARLKQIHLGCFSAAFKGQFALTVSVPSIYSLDDASLPVTIYKIWSLRKFKRTFL